MFKSILFFAAATSAAVIPTRTTPVSYTATVPLTGVTHTIAAGANSELRFLPDNKFDVRVGDVVEWHFNPKAHGVVQSGPDTPCLALEGGFSSGLVPVPEGQAEADQVFQIVVEDTKPIWYYCPQPAGGEGGHCAKGMVGVINPKVDVLTIDQFRSDAAQFKGTSELGVVGQKGELVDNPTLAAL
jgi:plastocyanin